MKLALLTAALIAYVQSTTLKLTPLDQNKVIGNQNIVGG